MFDEPCLRKSIWFKQGQNWRFLLSGFAKVDPTCEAKVELVYLVWWLWLSFDLIHDLSIFNRLLLCSLNPGISPIFESLYLHSRVLPYNFDQSTFSPLPQSLV